MVRSPSGLLSALGLAIVLANAGRSQVISDPRIVDRPEGYMGEVVFSLDHELLAISEDNNEIRLVSVVSGKTVGQLVGHIGAVSAIAFSHDGRTLVSSALDNTMRLWEVGTHREVTRAQASHCISLAFAPNDLTLVSGHLDRHIGLIFWDVRADAIVRAHTTETRRVNGHLVVPAPLRYSPNGEWIAFGRGSINLLKVADQSIRVLEDPEFRESFGRDYLFALEKNMLVSVTWSGRLTAWDLTAGTILISKPNEALDFPLTHVTSQVIVPGSTTLLAGTESGSYATWDLTLRKPIKIGRLSDLHSKVILSPDCKAAAIMHEKQLYMVDIAWSE